MSNKGFTIEQHQELATDLKQIRTLLNQALRTVSNAYGLQAREVALIERIKREASVFRSAMDNHIIKENSGKNLNELNFYYKG